MLLDVSVSKVHCTRCRFSVSSRSVCLSHCMHTTLLLSFSISSATKWNTSSCWDTSKSQSHPWLTGGALIWFWPSPFSDTCQGLCLQSSMAHSPHTIIPVNLCLPGTLCAPGLSSVMGKQLFDPLAITAVTITAAGLWTRYKTIRCKPHFSCLFLHLS